MDQRPKKHYGVIECLTYYIAIFLFSRVSEEKTLYTGACAGDRQGAEVLALPTYCTCQTATGNDSHCQEGGDLVMCDFLNVGEYTFLMPEYAS